MLPVRARAVRGVAECEEEHQRHVAAMNATASSLKTLGAFRDAVNNAKRDTTVADSWNRARA